MELLYTFHDMMSVGNFIFRIPLDKWGKKKTLLTWTRDFSSKHFLVCNFLLKMSTFKLTINLTFGRNRFGKRTVYIF